MQPKTRFVKAEIVESFYRAKGITVQDMGTFMRFSTRGRKAVVKPIVENMNGRGVEFEYDEQRQRLDIPWLPVPGWFEPPDLLIF